MSGADPEDVTVTAEEVTVRKSVDLDQFQTLAVVFDVSWDQNETGRIQLIDHVPEDVSLDDIGFHPDYDADHWSVEHDHVVFEREFEPGEEYTTIYGIRDYDEADTGALMTDPVVDVFSPDELDEGEVAGDEEAASGIEGVSPGERSGAVRDLLAGESEGLPGLDEEAAPGAESGADAEEAAETADADVVETAETADADAVETAETAEDAGAAETAGGDEAAEPVAATAGDDDPTEATVETSESGEITVPITGGVARVLVKELRQGTVSEEDRRLLREELGPGEGSTEARIEHLQSRVSDLEAYSGALEAFLDEEGTAQQVLDDLSTETEALSDEVERLEDRLDATEERLEMLDGTVAEVEDDLDAVEETVADAEEELGELHDEVEDVRGDLGDRLSDVEEDLEALHEEVEDIAAFRDRLSSVFGPGGAADAAAAGGDGEGGDGENGDGADGE